MGVDIYLSSIWDPFEESLEESDFMERIARRCGDNPLARAEAIYDAYRESGGYFRNGYNATDVMAAIGLDWGMVYKMCDAEHRLPVKRARELVAMIEARPWAHETYAHHLMHHGHGRIQKMIDEATGQPSAPPDIDAFFAFTSERREQLLAILRKSIALNEPLLVS
jgi:hypothetical protein